MKMNPDYKKYSLEQLENWMHDAISCGEATPQEIYDVIKGVVDENYHIYKNHTEKCYELLALLNGNGIGHIKAYDDYVTDPRGNKVKVCDKDDPSTECKQSWNDFWEETYYPDEYYQNVKPSATQTDIDNQSQKVTDDCMPPWGHSDMEALRYTEEELNAMCDKAASEEEKKKSVTELSYEQAIAAGWELTADGFWVPPQKDYLGWKDVSSEEFDKIFPKKDKVKKWILPVEEIRDEDTDEDIYCVTFPDDLLEAADLKEGDQVYWVDNGDGTWMIRKVKK